MSTNFEAGMREIAGNPEALRAQRDELLSAMRDSMVDQDWPYVGTEADTDKPKSLYNRVKRALAAIAKAAS